MNRIRYNALLMDFFLFLLIRRKENSFKGMSANLKRDDRIVIEIRRNRHAGEEKMFTINIIIPHYNRLTQ